MGTDNIAAADRLVREKEACCLLGVSASTLRRLERRGSIARRRSISPNTRAWLLSELQDFMMATAPNGDAER